MSSVVSEFSLQPLDSILTFEGVQVKGKEGILAKFQVRIQPKMVSGRQLLNRRNF